MRRRLARLTLATLAVLAAGCASAPDWERAGAQRVGDADLAAVYGGGPDGRSASGRGRRWSGSVTAVAAPRPALPHGRLQLPAVSPDGNRVACLTQGGDAARPESLLTGRNLVGTALRVRAIDVEGDGTPIASGGVCWPAWSPDGNTLYFIEYDEQLGCTLGVHDAASGTTRRKGVGLQRMFSPAPRPGGGTKVVAVSAYGNVPDDALVFLIDVDRGVAEPGPPPSSASASAQVAPVWLNPQTLLYVELGSDAGHASLRQWRVGSDTTDRVADLGGALTVYDAPALLAGIGAPLSPGRDRLALYRPDRNRTELIPLDRGPVRPLTAGSQSGAWWDTRWWALATADGTELVSTITPDRGPGDRGDRLSLLPGRWAPVWVQPTADTDGKSMLLVGPGATPDTLSLMQLWLVVKGE